MQWYWLSLIQYMRFWGAFSNFMIKMSKFIRQKIITGNVLVNRCDEIFEAQNTTFRTKLFTQLVLLFCCCRLFLIIARYFLQKKLNWIPFNIMYFLLNLFLWPNFPTWRFFLSFNGGSEVCSLTFHSPLFKRVDWSNTVSSHFFF